MFASFNRPGWRDGGGRIWGCFVGSIIQRLVCSCVCLLEVTKPVASQAAQRRVAAHVVTHSHIRSGGTRDTGASVSVIPGASVPLTAQPCLGSQVTECLKTLSTILPHVSSDLQEMLVRFNSTDVSGKPYAGERKVMVYGVLPGEARAISVALTLDVLNRVTFVDFTIPANPALANTEAEYDRTWIYTLASAVLPQTCEERNKMAFYRFFQDTVKPTFSVTGGDTYVSQGDAKDTVIQKSNFVKVCGLSMQYTRESGVATWAIDENNIEGHVDDKHMTFEAAS